MKKEGLGIIGCGKMGAILADSVVSSGVYPSSSVYVSDVRKEQREKLKKTLGVIPADNRTIAEKSSVIILAVKPDKVKEVLTEIRGSLTSSTILI
jgi:pyrroline-5-carboxylate reductase